MRHVLANGVPLVPCPRNKMDLTEGSRRDGFFEARAKGEDTRTNTPNSLTGENFGARWNPPTYEAFSFDRIAKR